MQLHWFELTGYCQNICGSLNEPPAVHGDDQFPGQYPFAGPPGFVDPHTRSVEVEGILHRAELVYSNVAKGKVAPARPQPPALEFDTDVLITLNFQNLSWRRLIRQVLRHYFVAFCLKIPNSHARTL